MRGQSMAEGGQDRSSSGLPKQEIPFSPPSPQVACLPFHLYRLNRHLLHLKNLKTSKSKFISFNYIYIYLYNYTHTRTQHFIPSTEDRQKTCGTISLERFLFVFPKLYHRSDFHLFQGLQRQLLLTDRSLRVQIQRHSPTTPPFLGVT